MLTFTLTPAEFQDIDSLVALEKKVFIEADGLLSKRAFRYHLGSKNILLVARQSNPTNPVIGYLLFFVRTKSARLYSLAVHPDFQRHGVARSLYAQALKILNNKGIYKLSLELRPSNTTALKLYQSLGFEQKTIRPHYYSDGESALCLSLKGLEQR
ncbi:MAG: GNAT family N-acetyltransferase [Cycloclasticus sp.]|nr:GNAT family N-acetyltransferase [Cycloclasticus sp.]MBQ0789637.1 GNAT family N-acetyltransferase [Cycloclasticus sp.]